MVERSPTRWRVRRVETLHEHFALAVAHDGEIRCDYRVTLLGITAMRMHDTITRRRAAATEVEHETVRGGVQG